MKIAKGKLEELYLDGCARILCPPMLIPSPGQYLLAHADGSDSPLPVSLFPSLVLPDGGFRSAPPVPSSWRPGDSLTLRGPIGRGFHIPAAARKIALIAFDDSPARLLGLVAPALKQNAGIVLVSDSQTDDLPEVIEVQPLKALEDILHWAEYAAFDVDRENLNQLRERLEGLNQPASKGEAQVLIRAPMPCGGIADCGVCALSLRHDWKMICRDGPVFELEDVFFAR